MTWNTTAPDGSKSVKDNETILQENTTHLGTYLNLDHFWGIGGTSDGHHRFVSCPEDATDGGPALAGIANGLYYVANNGGRSQPFFKNTAVMELLGIRAMSVFSGLEPFTQAYSLNIGNIARTAGQDTGFYTVTFASNLPSVNYAVFIGGMQKTTGITPAINRNLICTVDSNSALDITKKKESFQFHCVAEDNNPRNPLQVWFICFGG